MSKKVLIGLAVALAFALGIWLTRNYYKGLEVKSEEQQQVLLEKIKSVSKLITVEGYFSEIYDYKEYWGYDLSPFQKKALIRVKAKVSVGYDMSNMQIDADALTKTITISELPDPEILSIDHDLDYYDTSEGLFNSFTPQELTRLNQKAKNYIREKADESDLIIAAVEQGNKTTDIIKFMAESMGWTVKYKTEGGFIENQDTTIHLN